jgi:hypothetical protein
MQLPMYYVHTTKPMYYVHTEIVQLKSKSSLALAHADLR